MVEKAAQLTKESLDSEIDNRQAITALMVRYDVDEPTAKELWDRFLGTVRKIRLDAEQKEEPIHSQQ